MTCIDNGVLALHAGHEFLLLDVHDQVLALIVAWDPGDGNVDVADRLYPLVGERSLFFLLFGEGCCRLGRGGLCQTGRVSRGCNSNHRKVVLLGIKKLVKLLTFVRHLCCCFLERGVEKFEDCIKSQKKMEGRIDFDPSPRPPPPPHSTDHGKEPRGNLSVELPTAWTPVSHLLLRNFSRFLPPGVLLHFKACRSINSLLHPCMHAP